MKILLANPRGFCAGVDRAITIVDRALEQFETPIYVRHEVVHNRFVVDNLKARGAVFIEELSEVPEGSVLIFSAHGVPKSVEREARSRNLKIFDATCPLVSKVHIQVARASTKGEEIILIGHAGHAEVEGTLGQYDNNAAGIYLIEKKEDIEQLQNKVKNADVLSHVSQTTLSIDETKDIIDGLKVVFPNIASPRKNDICYATQNRQNAVKKLAQQSDVVVVVGSKNSSNSNRLKELATRLDTNAYLTDAPDDIKVEWFSGVKTIGVTAGASAPEELVNQIINKISSLVTTDGQSCQVVELDGCKEEMAFDVPKELREE